MNCRMSRRNHPGLRVKFILIFVFSITIIMFILRNYGLPQLWFWERPDRPAFMHYAINTIGSAIGTREVTYYTNGLVKSVELHRGPYYRLSPGSGICAMPVIKGDYYSISGEKISSIRSGNGVKVDFYEDNGRFYAVSLLNKGRIYTTFASWYKNGRVRRCAALTDFGEQPCLEALFPYDVSSNAYMRWYVNKDLVRETNNIEIWQCVGYK